MTKEEDGTRKGRHLVLRRDGTVEERHDGEVVMTTAPAQTGGLWRNQDGTREGKYLVTRRDGTALEHPYFVLGARDPAAPAALRAYADESERQGRDPRYVADVRAMADEFDAYRQAHGAGDPDARRHRVDDPATVARMREGRSA